MWWPCLIYLVVSCYLLLEKDPGKVWIAGTLNSLTHVLGTAERKVGSLKAPALAKATSSSPLHCLLSVQVWAGGFLVLLPSGMWRCPTSLILSTTTLVMAWSSTWQGSLSHWEDTVCTAHAQGPSLHPRDAEPDAYYSNCLGQSK